MDILSTEMCNWKLSYSKAITIESCNWIDFISLAYARWCHWRCGRTQLSAATINQVACPSYSLYVQLLWYSMLYPKGMKARVSPVQWSKPYSISAPTQDSNPGERIQNHKRWHYTTTAHRERLRLFVFLIYHRDATYTAIRTSRLSSTGGCPTGSVTGNPVHPGTCQWKEFSSSTNMQMR